jgi:hypothetical protein
VVRDTYLEWVGTAEDRPAPGSGYGDTPLERRHPCANGCSSPPPSVIGSVFSPDDEEMWTHRPHQALKMDHRQREEWARLIRRMSTRWWQFWK